jgi:hypothetical protein
VCFGMIAATGIGIFMVSVLYVLVEGLKEKLTRRAPATAPAPDREGVQRCVPLSLIVMLFLAGCTVGPNYHKPQVQVPQSYRNGEAPKPGEAENSIADLPWWEIFKDAVLQNMIRTALERNYDVGSRRRGSSPPARKSA